MQSVIIDQEFKNLIPPLSTEEKNGLEENIVRDGCRESLITWGGVIVDGHNRFEICTRLNIPFKHEDMFFEDRDAVVEWIIKNQFGRRNLSLYDRTKLALRLEDVYRVRAKANQVVRKGDQIGTSPPISAKLSFVDTREEIAKIAGVGHNTVTQVKAIEAAATTEQKAAISKGEKSINKIYLEIKGSKNDKGVSDSNPKKTIQPYSNAFQFSTIAISQLSRIREDDPQRVAALMEVKEYIDNQLNN